MVHRRADEAELGGTLETTIADWADAAHAQGGTVVMPHLPNPNGEPAALIATGRADAVEMIRPAPTPTWSTTATSTAAIGCRWSAAPTR